MAMQYRPYGRAYGDALGAALEAVGRATPICAVPFPSPEEAVATAAAFQRLERILGRHLRFLVGPRESIPVEPIDVAAMELAAAMEDNAAGAGMGIGAVTHPAGLAWVAAAESLGTAHDILASHLDIDRKPLTPDGELVLQLAERRQIVNRLADLTLTLEKQRVGLRRQLAAAGSLSSRAAPLVLREVQLDHPSPSQAAARLLDLSKGEIRSSLLDRVDLAPPTRIADLPNDPLDRAVLLVGSLRRYAYDIMRQGHGLGADGMCSYAALGVDVVGHTVAVMKAAHARAIVLLGDDVGTLAQPVLAQGITSMHLLGRRWRSVYRQWAQISSLQATPTLVRHHVLLVREALAAVSRNGYRDKRAVDLLPDAARLSRAIEATARLVSYLGPLAQHQLATTQHMQASADLFSPSAAAAPPRAGPERRGPQHIQLPPMAFRGLCDAYEDAAQAGVRAMTHLEPLYQTIGVQRPSLVRSPPSASLGLGL
jgi:hypothetical protein